MYVGPEGILNLVSGNSRPSKPITTTSVQVSKIAAIAMPRYIFSANINTPVYFERTPYFNLSSKLVTRVLVRLFVLII